MTIGIVAFLCALSVGAWIYNKMYNRSGGNTKSSLIFAGVVGALVFLVVFTIGSSFL